MRARWLLVLVCGACGSEAVTPKVASPPTITNAPTNAAPNAPTNAAAKPPTAVPQTPSPDYANTGEFELNKTFAPRLLEIAKQYTKWMRVDERPNVAPLLCRAPLPSDRGTPSQVRISKATASKSPHGRKLYFLYAKHKHTYLKLTATSNNAVPVGQAIVKQAWHAVPATKPAASPNARPSFHYLPPPIRIAKDKRGRLLTTGKQADLYIIYKLAKSTPGTDDGYVYGTVTADGKTVTSAGRVKRCMGCHDNAPHERLFGLKR